MAVSLLLLKLVTFSIRYCLVRRVAPVYNSFSDLCWGKALVAYTKPKQERKKKAKGYEEREVRSSLLILDLKDGSL